MQMQTVKRKKKLYSKTLISRDHTLLMADTARTNLSFHRLQRSHPAQQLNMAFITMGFYFSQEQPAPAPTSRHTILVFTVPVVLNFLLLMYQGKADSPFETHPKAMLIAVASLLMYCWAYDAELRISSTHPSPTYTWAVHCSMMVFGLFTVVSLVSILLPSYISPVIYLLTAGGLLRCRLQMLWNWLNQRIMGEHSGDHILPL